MLQIQWTGNTRVKSTTVCLNFALPDLQRPATRMHDYEMSRSSRRRYAEWSYPFMCDGFVLFNEIDPKGAARKATDESWRVACYVIVLPGLKHQTFEFHSCKRDHFKHTIIIIIYIVKIWFAHTEDLFYPLGPFNLTLAIRVFPKHISRLMFSI